MVAGFPLAFAGVVPPGFVLVGVLLVTCLYFAMADFLHIGRLAAYVAICQWPKVPPAPAIRYASPAVAPRARVDPDELILGDIPAM
jgi:hypothetical protein